VMKGPREIRTSQTEVGSALLMGVKQIRSRRKKKKKRNPARKLNAKKKPRGIWKDSGALKNPGKKKTKNGNTCNSDGETKDKVKGTAERLNEMDPRKENPGVKEARRGRMRGGPNRKLRC